MNKERKLSSFAENDYTSDVFSCNGCNNKCTIKSYKFSNGNEYYTGNNCEKIYSNKSESTYTGENIFAIKNRLLFNRKSITDSAVSIGIPRALGMYEEYPFWHTLFTECGIKVILSDISSNNLYNSGINSIMADNICFPAKLMHGHIINLVEKKVDRIFYPYTIFEKKEDKATGNSFNCPIVSGYSDVIRSAINPERKYGIPFDSPVINFNDTSLLKNSCTQYLLSLGIKKKNITTALEKALSEMESFHKELSERNEKILEKATAEGRMVIMMACRPYHIDQLIEHKLSYAISKMGVDIISENISRPFSDSIFEKINALSQWSYPNRIFKAASFVGNWPHNNLHFVQLTSFGCGPDAFIIDEVKSILSHYNKNVTLLKIDDVNNIGSLRLRIRSLIESIDTKKEIAGNEKEFQKTKIFDIEDRRRTLLAPYFAEGYSEFVPTIFSLLGYNLINLPSGTQEDVETGLKYANNEICYPATIVIGSILNALNSGKYNPDNVAVIITQTGGQCRASNYFSLIKNAIISAGYKDIPVISLAIGKGVNNNQPGFSVDWKSIINITIYTMLYADSLAKLYHSSAAREKVPGVAGKLYDKYIMAAKPIVLRKDTKGLVTLLHEAALEFSNNIVDKDLPKIGLVGEIYVKYNGFSNKFVTEWLIEQGLDVIPPSLTNFFLTSIVNNHVNRKLYIKKETVPTFITDNIHKYIMRCARKMDKQCECFKYYHPLASIFKLSEYAGRAICMAADFGEGWLLPGEIGELVHSGVNNIVSVQPFGCIANHIISKGIEKKLKEEYPYLNLLFLDFDGSTSDANIFNRLHFMVENAKKTHQNK
ncbi:MAG: 2-hydroxyacyl-CoA dehydratase [Paludibacteraceae bacterium]|nr:2-hydroxyacyl-CoA dehydratase [Paludibacteraceae bacterium]